MLKFIPKPSPALILLFIVCAYTFIGVLGCKKDLYESKSKHTVDNSLLQSLKAEFAKNNYAASLTHTVNDTIQINWVPNWEHASQKEHGDTLKYIYIPLNGQATSPHVKKAVKLRTVNNERYLIVTMTKSATTFKLASYDANTAVIKTGQKNQAINSTGAKKINYFNHTIPFNNFTGGLVTKDLKTGKQNSYYYLQGKNNNTAASIGGAKVSTNALSTNRLCLVTLRCHWFNNFPEYCGPEATYTERTSYINEGETVYDTDCGGVPTETYMDGVNLCVPGWIYDGIEIVSSECQDDPAPPDTPPGDPGSGGGGTGDGSTTPSDPADTAKIVKNFCDDLTSAQQATIINTIKEFENYNCLTKYLYNTISGGNVSGYSFCIVDGMGSANYSASTKTISFTTEYTITRSDVLGHELFHAYQDMYYPGGTASYGRNAATGVASPGFSNIEFEQAIFSDILYNERTAFQNGSPQQKNAYENWLTTITNDFTTYPKLTAGTTAYNNFITQYNGFLSQFSSIAESAYYGPTISLNPSAIITLFNQSNCN
jgi:hypothetical protein